MSRHRPNPQHRQGGNGNPNNPNNGQSGFSRQLPTIPVGISSPYTERAARAAIMVDQAYGRVSRRYGRKQMDGGKFRKFTNQIETAVLEFERAIHNAMNGMNHDARPSPNAGQKPQVARPAPAGGKAPPATGKTVPVAPAASSARVAAETKTGGNGHDKTAVPVAATGKTGGNGAAADGDDVLKNLQGLTEKLSAERAGKKVGVRGARSSSTAKQATPSP